jgi:N,N-dimethylformamidase
MVRRTDPAPAGSRPDKIRPGSKGFQVVAVGKNSEGPAFMVCRDMPGGGFVFNVSSISFTPCLDDDAFIQKLVRNLIGHAMLVDVSQHTRTGAPAGNSQ